MRLTTCLSSKGQVILPKSVRNAHHWDAGVRFAVEDREDGVLLRPLAQRAATTLDAVVGCMGYAGPARSLEEMDAAIARGVAEMTARDAA